MCACCLLWTAFTNDRDRSIDGDASECDKRSAAAVAAGEPTQHLIKPFPYVGRWIAYLSNHHPNIIFILNRTTLKPSGCTTLLSISLSSIAIVGSVFGSSWVARQRQRPQYPLNNSVIYQSFIIYWTFSFLASTKQRISCSFCCHTFTHVMSAILMICAPFVWIGLSSLNECAKYI